MSEPSDDSPDTERVKNAVAALAEHFDTVQIFATRYDGGEGNGTRRWQHGRGNWFARYGQVHEWLEREKETTRLDVKQQQEED